MSAAPQRLHERFWCGPAAVALIAAIAVLATANPTANGPALTVDEPFNVDQGRLLVQAAADSGLWIFDPAIQQQLFQLTLNDHPPAGRLAIGLCERLSGSTAATADQKVAYSIAYARIAPAIAFSALVFLVGLAASVWYGRPAGVMTSLSLLLMPRVFGHAHIASLETFINLTYAAAVLAVAHYWSGEQPPTKRTAALTGLLFGLALLSKVQAIFIPIPVILWTLWRWRLRALVPLTVWGLAALALFYAGWPYLWVAPVDHLLEYLGRTTERVVLHNWYLGRQFPDRETPWHYPLVMFAVTIPLGIQALALLGVSRLRGTFRKMPREWLLLGCTLLPLLVFSLPGTPVYDGVRLFLVAYPLWTIFAGRGGQVVYEWLRQRLGSAKSRWLLAGLFTLQAYGVVFFAPCWLSYYNLAVGGLRGADRLGFERTYWGDSVTHPFIKDVVQSVPRGSTIFVTPILHQFQLDAMRAQEPLFSSHDLVLSEYNGQPLGENEYVLVYYRRANLDDDVTKNREPIVELRRENVPLAGLYR